MKKRLIGAAAIVAALAVSPKIIGNQVKQHLQQTAENISALPQYSAQIEELQSNWFSTDAVLVINLDVSDMNAQQDAALFENDELSFKVSVNVRHGLVITGDHPEVGYVQWQLASMDKPEVSGLTFATEDAVYQAKGSVGLFGGMTYQDKVQSFTFEPQDSETDGLFSFSGFAGQGHGDSKQFSYAGAMDSMTFQDNENQFELAGLSVDATLHSNWLEALASQFYDSFMNLKIERMTFDGAEEMQVAINQFATEVTTSLSDDEQLISMVQNISVNDVTVKEDQARDLHLNMAFNNLRIDAIKAYQEMATELAGLDQQGQIEAFQGFVKQHLLNLLTANPELNLSKFSGTLPQGDFLIENSNALNGIDTLPVNMEDPRFWLDHATSKTDMSINRELVTAMVTFYLLDQINQNPQAASLTPEQKSAYAEQQAPAFIDSLIEQGLLVQNEDMIQSKIVLIDGQLSVNDNPIPLPF